LQRQLDKKAEGTAQNISPAFRIYANGFPTPFGATFFFGAQIYFLPSPWRALPICTIIIL